MTGIYYTPSHVFEPCQIYDTCSNVGEFLERSMIGITATKDGLKWVTHVPQIDTKRLAMLMKLYPNCTVEPQAGNSVYLWDLQDNQAVAKGGNGYHFLITKKEIL